MLTRSNIKVTVEEINSESFVVKRFKLVPINGYQLPKFCGGSHITTL
ncbi:hypothetical protein [Niallia sp. 03133]